MNLILHRYLLEHHRLDLPGLGFIQLERVPATYDFAAGLLRAPAYESRFFKAAPGENHHLDAYLAEALSVPPDQARLALQTYVGDLHQALETKGSWALGPIGQLKRLSNGDLVLEPTEGSISQPEPVSVSRIIRVKESGADVDEPAALPISPDRWWIAAAVLAVLSLVLLLAGRIQSNSWLFNP